MQDAPLTLVHFFDRAERLFRDKTVTTATGSPPVSGETSPFPSSMTTRCVTVLNVGRRGTSRPQSDRSTKTTWSSAGLTL